MAGAYATKAYCKKRRKDIFFFVFNVQDIHLELKEEPQV